jgi:hypothetical protein
LRLNLTGSLHREAWDPLGGRPDRGDVEAWRELYRLASTDATLRRRILGVVRRVPLPFPCFWLAALASLGEDIDWSTSLPRDDGMA